MADIAELTHAYEVFGIPPTSSAIQIKQAYRKFTKRWHPETSTNPVPHSKLKLRR